MSTSLASDPRPHPVDIVVPTGRGYDIQSFRAVIQRDPASATDHQYTTTVATIAGGVRLSSLTWRFDQYERPIDRDAGLQGAEVRLLQSHASIDVFVIAAGGTVPVSTAASLQRVGGRAVTWIAGFRLLRLVSRKASNTLTADDASNVGLGDLVG